MDCNSLIGRSENVCGECGSALHPPESKMPGLLYRAITALFFLSFALPLAALFLDEGPGLAPSLIACGGLLFLRHTAKDYVEKSSRQP